jgi:hypothetical protein
MVIPFSIIANAVLKIKILLPLIGAFSGAFRQP